MLILYDYLFMIYRLFFLKNKNIIYIFGSPRHSNMGDQAQTYCIIRWAKLNYPNYNVLVFTKAIVNDMILRLLRLVIKKSDKIFIHSGYHLTDLYDEKRVYCKVLKLFPDFRILVFPQTVNFVKSVEDEKYVSEVFNNHGNILLCCRDEISYKKAKMLFPDCELLLYPDIVTALIGKMHYKNKRDGILFCMRNDIEAFYEKKQILEFFNLFEKETIKMTDTTLDLSYYYIREHREKILKQIFEEYSRYKVVVTDRYHGTIFSLIAGTPVVVLSSKDHKLYSGVRWFPESYHKYVYYAENLAEAYKIVLNILQDKTLAYCLPSYFEEKYYSKLKSYYELV